MFAGEAVIESIDNRRRSASLRFVHQFSLTPDPLKTQIFAAPIERGKGEAVLRKTRNRAK
jgi:hypothetical protein